MSLKALRACGHLVPGALAVFEARNRLKGVLDGFRARYGVAAITREAVATAFPADGVDVDCIFDCASKLQAALVALDKIADSLPENDLPRDGAV
ncbi:MAG TPA: hypothetical protein VEA38_12155 [Terriglobales bacterium]|nr:hypothetical protein [Terriglobales bacterium]